MHRHCHYFMRYINLRWDMCDWDPNLPNIMRTKVYNTLFIYLINRSKTYRNAMGNQFRYHAHAVCSSSKGDLAEATCVSFLHHNKWSMLAMFLYLYFDYVLLGWCQPVIDKTQVFWKTCSKKQSMKQRIWLTLTLIMVKKWDTCSFPYFDVLYHNRPISHLARHQRPARERHKICIASRENVDNQVPRNTNFTHKHVSIYF